MEGSGRGEKMKNEECRIKNEKSFGRFGSDIQMLDVA